jgi:energy-coupling factor transport system ATP-binding protein
LPEGPLDVDSVAARIRARGITIGAPAPIPRSGVAGDPLIDFRHVTSGYPGGADALRDLSFTIRRGECLALLGQNGSGKTALAKHAVGLIKPRQGALDIKGKPGAAWLLSDRSRVAGYVFQNPDHQIFSDTVGEEAAFGARNLGLAPAEVARRVAEALEATGLSGRESEDPFTLSKGERERLAVASLLAYRPEAVFFDEPTTGLDADEARRMMDFIRKLNRDGMTVILITHAMWAAAEYADRVAVLAQGRVMLDAPTAEVFSREDVLTPLALAPPPAAALANRLGVNALDTTTLLRALGVGPAA